MPLSVSELVIHASTPRHPCRYAGFEPWSEPSAHRLAALKIGLRNDKINTAEPIRHHLHDLDGEERGFLNKKKEVPFIDGLESAISPRNGGGDSCFLVDEAEFAKDAVGENRFEMEIINENVDFTFLDNVHLLPFVSLLENGCPGRKGPGFRRICVDVADSRWFRIPEAMAPVTNCARLIESLPHVSSFLIFRASSLSGSENSLLGIGLEAQEGNNTFSVLQNAISQRF
jgi:hypothetical protein